jgi:chemosensory pili system protein ChpA (sensor histidine kinase/response regulator)
MLQLPDYLESIQSGGLDAPIVLMPLINDLRAVRKEGLLTESSLFSPDIDNAVLPAKGYDADADADAIQPGRLAPEAKRLRTHYQLGLLDFIRNNKKLAGLKRIKAVLTALEKVSSDAAVRRLWIVINALVEGLMKEGIDENITIKMLLGAVDRQFKLLIDEGDEAFAKDYSRQLVTNALYYIGTSSVSSPLVDMVKDAYNLDQLIPHGVDDSAATVGGLNADLFDTVSVGITEDLAQVKDVLELFMTSDEKDLQRLVPVAEQLGKIADTYGMLGMGATRQAIMDQKTALDAVVNAEAELSEQMVLAIASQLLNAESELKNYIAERSGFIDVNREHDDSAVPAAEYRQVVLTVVAEGLKNFSEAKEAILSYVSGIGDKEQLDIILNKLEEVRGVSMMLSLGRVGELIVKLQDYIRVALKAGDHQPDAAEQDTVADIVTSIEYFFEALSEGRPGVEQGLTAGESAAATLTAVTDSYGGAASVADEAETPEQASAPSTEQAPDVEGEAIELDVTEQLTDQDDLAADDLAADDQAANDQATSDQATSDQAASDQAANDQAANEPGDEQADHAVEQHAVVSNLTGVSVDVGEYAILADDADEEIVEIFIEEAVEVLGELHENLPLWKANHDDEEALAVVRRSFHTLKGSGRLLGAELIGEFSWKFENMLNRVIDKKITVSDTLLQAMDEALGVLPQLIEQLKGNREPVENIGELMAVADALAEGKDVSLETVPVEQAAPASTEPQSAEHEVEEQPAEVESAEAGAETGADTGSIEIEDISLDAVSEQDIELLEPDAGIDSDSVDTLEVQAADEEITIDSAADDAFDIDDELGIDLSDADFSGVDEDAEIEMIGAPPGDLETIDFESLEPSSAESSALEPSADEEIVFDEVSMSVEDLVAADDEAGFHTGEDIAITEDEETVQPVTQEVSSVDSGKPLEIDEMLLKIYHDESQGHIETVRQLLGQGDSVQVLADKNLMRAFHTLYGSARTAEIDAIAELCGATEKYIKARQDGGVEAIPVDIVSLFREVEQNVSAMLDVVGKGNSPANNKPLLDRVNKVVQKEIQDQLQRSWQQSSAAAESAPAEQDIEPVSVPAEPVDGDFDISDLSPDAAPVGTDLPEAEPAAPLEQQLPAEQVPQVEEPPIEMSYGDIDGELIDIFLEEADELLESCEATLADIIAEPNSTDHIHQLQRNMHTLKGGARMAELTPVGDLTHNLESLVVLVSEGKVQTDKKLFDLLQESVDILTNLLGEVKQRKPLSPVGDINRRIEMIMRGEIEEKRSVERFDVDLSQLEPGEDEEELEDIDISSLLPKKSAQAERDDAAGAKADSEQQVLKRRKEDAGIPQRRAEDEAEKPHWGERATDVSFKDAQEQVRVRSDLLNNLVNYAGEVNIYHSRMSKQISDFSFNLSELTQTVVRLKEQLRNLEIETEIQIRSGYEKESGDSFDADFDPLEMDQYSTLQQLTRSLSETAGDVQSINDILSDITRDSETLLMQESRVSTDLQEGLMRTRMVRFGGLSSRLRRIVRQVSRELGKEVELVIEGEGTEVDRTVLDRIIAPLEHMLRNAVAHGIETPEARKILGKDEAGTITIDVNRQGTDVVINVTDDGAGMNVDKIRKKAIKAGYITEESQVSDHDVLQFILQSGFSTADEVTQVAGRGVGMDVVDSEIKQLGGVLDIDTERGQGSVFKIRLPLTLAINQALLVSTSDDVFAVPLASIEGVVRITGLELQRFYDSGNTHYEFNGIEYELKHLGGLLTGNQPDYSKQLRLFPVLLVHVGDQHFALHVDDLLGRREIVVKPVGLQIGAVRGIAGATILADGRVVLILEMSALVVAESLFKPREVVVEEQEIKPVKEVRKTIMVVDDSITIRKVTERMLSRYGIDVILAKDGVDATNQLQDRMPDLMLLDIEMPRMDGFEVASYVRNDDRLKDIPIIMITSRTGSKHRDKAMSIGVNEYLGKPYQEDDLVSNINKILHTSY